MRITGRNVCGRIADFELEDCTALVYLVDEDGLDDSDINADDWYGIDELEPLPPWTLSPEDTTRALRGEAGLRELKPEGTLTVNFTWEKEPPLPGLHDVYAGLNRVSLKENTEADRRVWLELLERLVPEDRDFRANRFRMDRGALLRYVWMDVRDWVGMEDASALEDAQEALSLFIVDEKRPELKREYTPRMLAWITEQYDDERIDRYSKHALALFRRCLTELVEQGHPRSLQRLGYLLYNDSEAFPADWPRTAELFERYYRLTGDPSACNTLGYIYFYGRNTAGEPDYASAFRCFSVAHAHGYFEATYKLGDMFMQGLGVQKNRETARRLYAQYLDENLERFCHGDDSCNLADIALRLSRCFLEAEGEERDTGRAYRMALIADLAIRRRVRNGDHYGDAKVFGGIQRQLGKCREAWGGVRDLAVVHPLEALWDNGFLHRLIRLSWKREAAGWSLRLSPMPYREEAKPPKLLLALPSLDAAWLLEELTLSCPMTLLPEGTPDAGNVTVSDFAPDGDRVVLRLGEAEVLTLRNVPCHYVLPEPEFRHILTDGPKYRVLTVSFNGEQTYDYLTYNMALRKGDMVSVPTGSSTVPLRIL